MTMAATAGQETRAPVDRERIVASIGVAAIVLWLLVAVALPLGMLFAKSLQNNKGEFVGLANFVHYFTTPALAASIGNSVFVAGLVTLIVTPLAFTFAYALTRSTM